jgi:hypothetical protein
VTRRKGYHCGRRTCRSCNARPDGHGSPCEAACLNCGDPFRPSPENDVLCPRCFSKAQAREEFNAGQEDWVSETAKYLAPYRDRYPDGSLSPWFGPMNESAYETRVREYEESTAGGGLWDPEEEARMGVRRAALRQAKRRVRDHVEAVVRWVERHGHELSHRHQAVATAVFKDGLGVRRAASRVGMHWRAVEQVVRELRDRAQGRKAS